MLNNYKLTIEQMGQIERYKKDNSFNHNLLSINGINLNTYNVSCDIRYRETIPLNMFEKYSIRIIDKAEEINYSTDISKIASLLHLDKKLIKDNLINLEKINMIYGATSDDISTNKSEYKEYFQYDNKFKKAKFRESFDLTEKEKENIETYVRDNFKKKSSNNKFDYFTILDEKKSFKEVYCLSFSDKQFLILGKNGINEENDLKFIDSNTFNELEKVDKVPKNTFCHYDEFLLKLKNILPKHQDSTIVIGSQILNESALSILPKNKDNIYILSKENENDRVFNIDIMGDFVWIDDKFYVKESEYIVEVLDIKRKKKVKQDLYDFFISKVLEIEPNYNYKKAKEISLLINEINDKINQLEFKDKKDFDKKIKDLNEQKNKLYGLKKNSNNNTIRNEINALNKDNKIEKLKKYPEFLKNRGNIVKKQKEVEKLEKDKSMLLDLDKELLQANTNKSKLISKKNKDAIKSIEKDLNNIERLKV